MVILNISLTTLCLNFLLVPSSTNCVPSIFLPPTLYVSLSSHSVHLIHSCCSIFCSQHLKLHFANITLCPTLSNLCSNCFSLYSFTFNPTLAIQLLPSNAQNTFYSMLSTLSTLSLHHAFHLQGLSFPRGGKEYVDCSVSSGLWN